MKILNSMSYTILVMLCLTLGLAPFVPEPHIWEKLKMLANGELTAAIDWFDLMMHGTPWLLLLAKVIAEFRNKPLS